MGNRKIYDKEGHAFFVTFSCYKRRKHLGRDHAKRIVVEILASELKKHDGKCLGFAVMPDHVHTVVWFSENEKLSIFMKQWKQRSSFQIKKYLLSEAGRYTKNFDLKDAIWQRHYYCFNIISENKLT